MKREYNTKEIARILDSFMAGETNLAEEQLLADYFRTHEVDEKWREYKQMFALFDSGKVDTEPAPSASSTDSSLVIRSLTSGRACSRPEVETSSDFPRSIAALTCCRACSRSEVEASSDFSRSIAALSFAIMGIAAVALIAFMLWPESHEMPIKQPVQQNVVTKAKGEGLRSSKATIPSLARLEEPPTPSPQPSPTPDPSPVGRETAPPQPSPVGRECGKRAIEEDDDPMVQLCSAEIELEQAVHQRQAAYEEEMMQRSMELMIYIMEQEDEEMPTGGVKTQKS